MPLTKRRLAVLVIATTLYIALNVATIAVQFIPGMVTYLFWGVIGPLVAIIAAWLYLRLGFESRRNWVISSLAVTGLYVVLGYSSLYYVGSLWASV